MFCRNCGKEVQSQAVVCVTCGCPPISNTKFCQSCGAETNLSAVACIKCGVKLTAPVSSDAKSKIAAGLLGIFLGGLGIHRFYLGYTTLGIVQIVVTLITCGVGTLWGFIEGILILTGSTITTDAQGKPFKD